MPNISNMQSVPTNSGGYPYVKINPGQSYQLHLIANDADPNDVLDMEAFGESFGLSVSPSSLFVSLTGNGNEIQGTFSWTPDTSAVRAQPYLAVFRTSDNFFYHDETIQFEVTMSSTSLSNIQATRISEIYPNPTNNRLFIPISSDISNNMSIEIYNMIGIRMTNNILDISRGHHLVIQDINLESGQYIVVIRDKSGNILESRELLMIK